MNIRKHIFFSEDQAKQLSLKLNVAISKKMTKPVPQKVRQYTSGTDLLHTTTLSSNLLQCECTLPPLC